MFVNEEYENYKYLVEASDNYICLAKSSGVTANWENPSTINVIYQYLKPSILTIEAERTFTTTTDFSKIETTDNYWERADLPELLTGTFIMIFFLLFIINGLTRFVRKGGVFFGS